jgi:hypothetical protein
MIRDCVIWSFEHHAWWRPGRWGYTNVLAEAGRYTQAEADQIVAEADQIVARVNVVAIHERAIVRTEAEAMMTLYRDMRPEQLRALREAFLIDRAQGAEANFCEDRLALIDAALAERREEET